jgi:hypothetical protein
MHELAALVEARLFRELAGRELCAVTHSLGGILVRYMTSAIRWRSVVMLAPPNQGSVVARTLADHPLFRLFFGPVGQEIRACDGWPEPPTPFAVIAGTRARSVGNLTSWLPQAMRPFGDDEPNDGTLAAWETRHPSMAAFATVDASHTWIMNHPRTRELVVRFLETGAF